jgi:uncharacterized protein YbjT (DUF2867 family)
MVEKLNSRLLITGANGHLGRRLINELPAGCQVQALVRSERARGILQKRLNSKAEVNIVLGDPSDPKDLARIGAGCTQVVHLIGSIKESAGNRYVDMHECPASALVEAGRSCHFSRITTVSILGADLNSTSACLRSRAATEEIFHAGPIPTTIIRVPMVLGESDRASFALAKRGSARVAVLFRGESLEQPIYAGDVIDALIRSLTRALTRDETFDLAGPESLSRSNLTERAAAMLNRSPKILSLPLFFGMLVAGLAERLSTKPPITREMLQLLDHDDAIDPDPAAERLGLALTPLQDTLRRCIANRLSK